MQLFSRNKAIVALSLGALALGACGDDVTVPVAPAAPITLSITPPSANMNVGEAVNFAVQISGGATAPTLASCTTSSATVATAAVSGSSCRVTAVAAGNATITATASTGQSAAASVSVAAPAPAITSLTVSPSAQALAIGGSVTIVPTVQPAGRTATYTYASSSAAIASVTSAGVVTAVAPGTATITVSATGTAAGFTTATINQAVTITVSDRAPGLTSLNVQPSTVALAQGGTQALTAAVAGPRQSAATITYGTSAPTIATVSTTGTITAVSAGTAVITVTAQSVEAGAFAASSITALVQVTVSPNAQVAIVNLTRGGSTIDISNVYDQIEANIAIQPNGQTVSEVNLWVCAPAETVAACAARTNGVPAARQSFTASGTQAATVQMYVNTAEFGSPDFTTGADANTLYKNGLRTLVATLTTSPAAASTIASNSISQVNLNNADGWTIQWTAPTNKANSAANITWYGGPSTPDALTPNATSGTGSFTVVPVIYTPDRTIVQAVLNMSTTCGSNITDRTRPFKGTYGTATRDTLGVVFSCSTASSADGSAPNVVSAVDNNNNTYAGTSLSAGVAKSIFNDFGNINNQSGSGYRQSLAYRPNYLYLPHDYAAPSITRFDVNRGTDGSATWADSAWVNGTYYMAGANPLSSQSSLRYTISDADVGLLSDNGSGSARAGASTRNTRFSVCALEAIPTTTRTSALNCTSPIATGGITATIASMGIPESANLTNSAYFAQVAETDRLGNKATSVVYSWDNTGAGGSSAARTPSAYTYAGAGQYSASVFGVDLQAPVLVAIPNSGEGAIVGFARTDRDSIYASGTPKFAVRFTDSRSGFTSCTGTTCQNSANQRAGTFQITRRMRPTLDSYTNDALVQGLNNWESDATSATISKSRSIDAGLYANDNTIREFAVSYFGEAARAVQTTSGPENEGVYQPGYYTFTGTLTDRAGNSTTIPARSIAMDQGTPVLASVSPRQLSSGSPAVVDVSGSDDLEVVAGELSVSYGLGSVTFRRTPAMTATANLGFWHNPFASITDNKLTTIVGNGTALGATPLQMPVPLLGQITQVNGANAPLAPNLIVGTGKPTAISARLFDIRATVTRSATVASTQFADSGASNVVSTVIAASQLANNTKNWTETAAVGYASPVGIQSWAMHDPVNAGSSVEFRARTSSSTTNAPFTRVHVLRRNASVPSEWEYVGDASYVNVLDQGTSRVYRWSFTGGASAQGQYNVAAIADQDVLIAVGADNAGIGLATQITAMGVAPLPTVFTTETVQLSSALDASYRNTDAAFTRTLSPSSNPQSANLSYTCSSSNSTFMTAQMGQNGVCTLTPTGTVSAVAGVKVALTFTILGLPQNSETYRAATITRTDTVVRLPDLAPVNAITSASITGSIPATLLPGNTFQLTAVPVLASGYAGSPTYNWTAAPVAGLSLTAGQGTATATYTWSATASSFNGQVTINAVVAAADAAGFIGNSTTPSSGPTTVAGYTDQDASFGGALTPANSIINASATLQLAMTPAGSSDPANTTLTACTTNNAAAATVSSTGLVTAAAVIQPDSAVITCTVSRTQNQYGGSNYAARGPVSTNSVRVNVVVPVSAISAVAVVGTIPATLTPGQTITLSANPTQPAGASAATYVWDAAPTGFTATGLTSGTAIYTWKGDTTRTGALTINVTASATASAGFTASSADNSVSGANDGFWETDTPFSFTATPNQLVLNPQTSSAPLTGAMTFTNNILSNPANNSYSCSESSTIIDITNAATGAYESTMGGDAFLVPQTATITCDMTRTQHSVGPLNFAARSGLTKATTTATVTVIPNSVQSVAFAVSGPVNMTLGGAVSTVATSRTVATTSGALTYTVNVNAGLFGATANLPIAGSVAIDAAGVMTITTTSLTVPGTYTVLVKLAGAGSPGQSFANDKTSAVAISVVVPAP